jgi:hypothetical protein
MTFSYLKEIFPRRGRKNREELCVLEDQDPF